MSDVVDVDVRHYQQCFLRRAFETETSVSVMENWSKNGKNQKSQEFTHFLPSSLFIWGPPNSGKSFLLEKSLKENHVRITIHMNCLEIMCGRRALLQSVLRQLVDEVGSGEDDIEKCDSLTTFVEQLDLLFRELRHEPAVFIIDQVEFLREDNDDLIRLLFCIREVVKSNICCVFLSRLPWRCFSHITSVPPVELHFPQYTSDEIFKIIVHRKKSQIYEYYVNMVLGVHYTACRDLMKLWKVIDLRYENFAHLARNEKENRNPTEGKLHLLWKSICPTLKSDFENLNSPNVKRSSDKGAEGSSLQMPRISVYLIIAAFLASRNPPTSDKRFFVKCKTTNQKRSENPSSKVIHAIPHSRLLGIFAHVSDHKFSLSTSIFSSIASICQLGFLSRNEGADALDEPKYRCHVSENFVRELCEVVDFNLDPYLFGLL